MTNIYIGLGIVALGLVNLWVTFSYPSFFNHLDQMKQSYGERRGLMAHLAFYVGLPVIGGLVFALSSFLST